MQDNTQAKPKLAIGQVWRDRVGWEVKIVDYQEGKVCPFECSKGRTYTNEGNYVASGATSQYDLVELVKDAPTQATKSTAKHVYFYSATVYRQGSQTNASGLYLSHGVKIQSESDYAEFLRCTANTLGAAHGELHVSNLSYLGESE